jgi:hypothetical protein
MKGCVALALNDCVDNVSYKINAGWNGWQQREQNLAIWKTELGVVSPASPGPCPALPPKPAA